MAVHYIEGRKGALRKWLYRVRKAVAPRARKLAVWAQTGREVFAKRRYDLEVPLFRSVELETRTRCNSTCSFCAASILTDQRPDVLMPEATFMKIVNELAALDYDGAIKFFVNNEPLLDKRTAEFIRTAKARIPGVSTEVHTNGLKLNPRNGRELMEAGLDLLYINNYTSEGKVHRGVQAFLDEVAPDYPDREIVFHLRLLEERLMNRAGTAPNAPPEPEPLPLPCILPFDEIVVTADGRVTICCQDHYFEAAVGNVKETSLREIWYGEGFRELREKLLNGDRSGNKFCAACDFRGFKNEHLTPAQLRKNRTVGDLLHD